MIDSEVKKLIAEQYARAKEILRENAEGHGKLSKLLIEKEIIYANDLEKIFGKRKWVSRTQELLRQDQEAIQAADALQGSSFTKPKDKGEIFIHESDNDGEKEDNTDASNKTDDTVENNHNKENPQANSKEE